ncbi:MAG: hypothetical protein E7605_00690 [Ruminococcaceae bacterium]|nr:hypothetical protein [Oscillospiraceae bacterium]
MRFSVIENECPAVGYFISVFPDSTGRIIRDPKLGIGKITRAAVYSRLLPFSVCSVAYAGLCDNHPTEKVSPLKKNAVTRKKLCR